MWLNRNWWFEHPNICRALIVEEPIIYLKGAGSTILYGCFTRTRTGSKPHFGSSTYLQGSYDSNAEGQVRDLWKTRTRNDCKEVCFILFDQLLHRSSCCNGNPEVRKSDLSWWYKVQYWTVPLASAIWSWITHSSPLLIFALDVYLESLIDDHSVLLLRKLGRFVKKLTWISKVRWIWCPSENIFTFWY
jgi:hypothetical protein